MTEFPYFFPIIIIIMKTTLYLVAYGHAIAMMYAIV